MALVTYLSVIDLAGAEQSAQRIIPRDDKPGDVDKEFPSDVEKDEEEV